MTISRWILAALASVLFISGPVAAGDLPKKAKEKAPSSPTAVSFDTKRVAISQDRTIEIIDTTSGKTLCKMMGHAEPVTALSFSADDKLLASGGKDRLVCVWDGLVGKQILALKVPSVPHGVFFSNEGRLVVVEGDRTRREFDPRTGAEVKVEKEKK